MINPQQTLPQKLKLKECSSFPAVIPAELKDMSPLSSNSLTRNFLRSSQRRTTNFPESNQKIRSSFRISKNVRQEPSKNHHLRI